MKINEKNLCAYAVSPTFAADKEGYLMKKGEVNKGFQKRWFVLKGNLLFYFEKRYDKEPLGVIILEGCTVELDENDAQFSFKIVFHGMGNRSYILCAECQESMEQWMKSLACASYDYMKLMVTDLQKQLKETNCNKVSTRGVNGSSPNAEGSENVSLISTNENFGCNNDLVTSHQTPSTSPHPPPRLRSNLHSRSQGISQVNVNHQPKTKFSGAVPVSGSCNNPGYSHHSSSRNKMNFKDIHTVYGRPVLRDRNEWRYRKREDESNKRTARTDLNAPLFREQNLLISL